MTWVAIDGPAGAGKSTIAKEISKRLEYLYVDTGALYRAIGLYMIEHEISMSNINDALEKVVIDLKFKNHEQRVFLCGEDVSEKIRVPEVSMMASKVSADAKVRAFLLDLQRDIARKNNVVMDGRDIGTVVLPEADVKIFLTASAEKRAQRRYKELLEKGIECDFEKVLLDIEKRDYDDSHRKIAPLKKAEGAILVDTSEYSLDESIELVLETIKNNLK